MPTRDSRDPDPALLRAVLRTDLLSFVREAFATVNPGDRYVDNWHIEAICHELVRLRGSGACRRRLIVGTVQRLGGYGLKRYDWSGCCRLGDRGWGGFCSWSILGPRTGHRVST
jgi:hypothetical protein